MSTGTLPRAVGTGGSVPVAFCQVCGSPDLDSLLFVGYLPPVNTMPLIGTRPVEQPAYPAELLQCRNCHLVQLGLIVDPEILFPPSYPYTSGTTRILRENFAQLYSEVSALIDLTSNDLVVDVGSNDGTLLSNFKNGGHRVKGIEPTNAADIANRNNIPTLISFFNAEAVRSVLAECGKARIVTAANVFAHIEGIHDIVNGITSLLDDNGIFISESHYWVSLLETLQYDTIYHEHLRYYSLTSLTYLLHMHGLEVFHARRIPTHGGSIRVYASRPGTFAVQPSVASILEDEKKAFNEKTFQAFRKGVIASKLGLLSILNDVKSTGGRVYGIGAPSRASTLINYVGLDDGIIDCVLEIPGSYKIGKYIPGTLIPVLSEDKLTEDQPEYALLLSWHIADELMPKLREKGFRGRFLIPLPEAHIVD